MAIVMSDPTITVPHFSLPLRMGVGDTLATVEQDSDDDVTQGVYVLLRTQLGRQIELPEYGYDDQTFKVAGRLDLSAAEDAVAAWQPRASIDIEADVDDVDELMQYVQVNVEYEQDDSDA